MAKYGKLLNQFLTADDLVNDNSAVQLAQILRNQQIVVAISHGDVDRGLKSI